MIYIYQCIRLLMYIIYIYIINIPILYPYYTIYLYNCVIIALFAGCSVILGLRDNLPCAAPFKSLQGLAVQFSFCSFLMSL